MLKTVKIAVVGMMISGGAFAQESGVKTYKAPEIEIGVGAIGSEGSKFDGDVFLGIEQGVLRRRVTTLEARVEILEGILVQLHGPEVKEHIDKMMRRYESEAPPPTDPEANGGASEANGAEGG